MIAETSRLLVGGGDGDEGANQIRSGQERHLILLLLLLLLLMLLDDGWRRGGHHGQPLLLTLLCLLVNVVEGDGEVDAAHAYSESE